MTLQVVTVTADELRVLVAEAVESALVAASRRQAAAVERLSATQAAKMLRRRPALVIAACASGSLPATRTGKSWCIAARDLDAWAAAGFPEAKP